MANRLTTERGGNIGLWISKPGFNVLTTGQANLIFNSDHAAMGVLGQGQHTVSNWPSGGGNVSQTISFGKTFPTPPLVTFERRIGNDYIKMGDLNGFYYLYSQEVYSIDLDGNQSYEGDRYMTVQARVFSNRIEVTGGWGYPSNTNPAQPPSFTFRWSAYDFNL